MRLALSNDALKMMLVPSLRFISHSLAATESSNSADSMTQGPAINIGFITSVRILLLAESLDNLLVYIVNTLHIELDNLAVVSYEAVNLTLNIGSLSVDST